MRLHTYRMMCTFCACSKVLFLLTRPTWCLLSLFGPLNSLPYLYYNLKCILLAVDVSIKLMDERKTVYGKCPKISNTKVSDKMIYANSADPDQTAPEGAVWSGSRLFAIPLSILSNRCIKSKIMAKTVWNKKFEILGHLDPVPGVSYLNLHCLIRLVCLTTYWLPYVTT